MSGQSLPFYERMNDAEGIFECTMWLGTICRTRERFREALELARARCDRHSCLCRFASVETSHVLGDVYVDQQRNDDALAIRSVRWPSSAGMAAHIAH